MDLSNQLTLTFSIERILSMPDIVPLSPAVTRTPYTPSTYPHYSYSVPQQACSNDNHFTNNNVHCSYKQSTKQSRGEKQVKKAVKETYKLSTYNRDEAPGKCRRAVFTEHQRCGLERAFESSQYIQKARRTQLAESLGLTELQVKVWFQNRRMKWRSSKEHQPTCKIEY